MQARRIAWVALVVAGAIAILASGAQAASTATLKIPLPAPNQVKVSVVTVKATAPKGKRVGALKLTARNSAQLGSAQTNTQVVYAMSPRSSKRRSQTFKVWVFIHRFASARRRKASSAQEEDVVLIARVPTPRGLARLSGVIGSLSCDELSHQKGPVLEKGQPPLKYNFLKDDFGQVVILGNLVTAFDTPAEEQLDNGMAAKCPGAEDPSNDPPPI